MNATIEAPPRQSKPKPPVDYVLVPSTAAPLPKRIEKLLRAHVRLKERAGEMFGKSSEKLQQAIEAVRGRGAKARRILTPGTLYRLSKPLGTNKGMKNTIKVVDNFDQFEVTKISRVPHYEVKMWKGDGPLDERDARAAGRAHNFNKEDELP
jgi:hypothetical protein